MKIPCHRLVPGWGKAHLCHSELAAACCGEISICKRRKSELVIGGDANFGSGKGCLAPRAWDVRGFHPVLISMRMSS